MVGHSLRAFLFLGVLATTAPAQSFHYPDFTDVSGLVMNGGASQASPVLRVTDANGNQAGTVFYDQAVGVVGGFETTFTFQLTNPTCGGADGMSFVLHNDEDGLSALGDTGSAMGYSYYSSSPAGTSIANSLVVEIDTWQSGGDISENEISVHTNGTGDNSHNEALSLGSVTPAGIDMSDGNVHTMRINYSPGTLDVYLDDMTTPVLSVTYDLTAGGTYSGGGSAGGLSLINGTDAYVGFTAATGGCTENHDVLSWEFGPATLGTPFCSSNANSTGSPSILTASGSTSLAANDFTLRCDSLPSTALLFFHASNQIQVPFGNGYLCAAGGIVRLYPFEVSNNGFHERTVDLMTEGTWSGAPFALGPRYFQCWYTDTAGGGANFNTSGGLEIVFVP